MTRHERIVVTGLGIICANGIGREAFWSNVCQGKSGIRPISSVDMTGIHAQVGGELADFQPEKFFSKKQLRLLDRCGQMAVIAAREAVTHARLEFALLNPYRVGIVLGTSLGGMVSGEAWHEQWVTRGLDKTSPRLLLRYPLHTPVDNICVDLGIRGPKSVISNACAAGTNAIGYAVDMLLSGKAEVLLTGGVDPLSHLSFSGFNCLSALCSDACAPYSKSNGLNLGEGAAILVLERLSHAQARQAPILAEVLGYALSADSYHQTAPDPGGSGALRAMTETLAMAKIPVSDLSYINGHGTGTPTNDLVEPKAIRALLKDEHSVPVSSTKSMLGHTLGAAGAIEGVTCILAIQDNILPPTINFDQQSQSYDFDFVPNEARSAPVDVALSNSFGFGGNNATVLFGKYPRQSHGHTTQQKKVVISGIGALAAGANGVAAIFDRLRLGQSALDQVVEFDASPYACTQAGIIRDAAYGKWINPNLLRKMDTISKQAVAATKFALDDSGFKITRANSEQVGVIFATGTGPVETVEAFNRAVIEQGAKSANPRLFPNTVMNAAAGHVCLHFKIKGPTSTITAGGVSALSALYYAHCLICRGVTDTIFVVSSDECNEPLVAGHARLPRFLSREKLRPFDRKRSGTLLGAASTAFLVQSEEAAQATGTRPYAELAGFGMTADAYGIATINPKGVEWARSFEQCLTDAGISRQEVGAVIAAANGHHLFDLAEARALSQAVGKDIPITAPKSIFGETNSSAGSLNILAGILALQEGILAPTAHLDEPMEEVQLDWVSGQARKIETDHVLVSSFAIGGNFHSLLLKRYQA